MDRALASSASVAVVGLAGRFPGAPDWRALWRLLREGREATCRPDDAALLAAGASPRDLADPHYVRACLPLDDMECFDAGFFGISPRDAAVMDPQHRHFIECCWEAMEDAGYAPGSGPERFAGAVGVFGGCGMQAYFARHLLPNEQLLRSMGLFLLRHTGNDKDFLTTRVSYLLDLRGPSVGVQTACSTSLVAVHLAAQSLLAGECDMALAGGASIELPHRTGYRHAPGEILSPDGRCRAFDDAAEGTVFGSGVGVVVLRRLEDALREGDAIWAVIRGSAVNNDGHAKAGYLAPGQDGQVQVAAEALAMAGLGGEEVDYIEGHGTGTPVGDPIEVAALSQAYAGAAPGAIGLGSIKTNIGHLDTAAGVAGLIKVCLALRHGHLPASLHFERPNRRFGARLPLRVIGQGRDWLRGERPRRAAVHALGVGGTNAHVVLEEGPSPSGPGDDAEGGAAAAWQLLPLSAHTEAALSALLARWRDWMDWQDWLERPKPPAPAHPEAVRAEPAMPAVSAMSAITPGEARPALADAAFTLQQGRAPRPWRIAYVARSWPQLQSALAGREASFATGGHAPALPAAAGVRGLESGPQALCVRGHAADAPPEVAWMFPGAGSHRPGACRDLIALPAFADAVRECLAALPPEAPSGLGPWLFEPEAADWLASPDRGLPALFILEMAIARLWQAAGVEPCAVMGHSAGEVAAACVAGLLSLPDALALACCRGRLLAQAGGGLLAVEAAEARLAPWLAEVGLDLAAVNAPGLCTVSGPSAALERLADRLAGEGIESRRLPLSVAAHSRALEPLLPALLARCEGLQALPGRRPFVSAMDGRWVMPGERLETAYWSRHLRQPVRCDLAMARLARAHPQAAWLECGPGQAMVSLARANGSGSSARLVLASAARPREGEEDLPQLLASAGALWCQGADLHWGALRGVRVARRVSLPTTPFARERHWAEAPGERSTCAEVPQTWALEEPTHGGSLEQVPSSLDAGRGAPALPPERLPRMQDWFSLDAWTPQALPPPGRGPQAGVAPLGQPPTRQGPTRWLLIGAQSARALPLRQALAAAGIECLEDAGSLGAGTPPPVVVHLGAWTPPQAAAGTAMDAGFDAGGRDAFDDVIRFARAWLEAGIESPSRWLFVTAGALGVAGQRPRAPLQAWALGPALVVPRELPGVRARLLDLDPDAEPHQAAQALLDEVAGDAGWGTPHALPVAAWREGRRWVPASHAFSTGSPVASPHARTTRLRQDGVYLLTGGLGGLGLLLAHWLARRCAPRLALVGRHDPGPQQRAQLRALESAGAQVRVYRADVADAARMAEVVADCQRRWGAIHGVFHAAGEMGDAPLALRPLPDMHRLIAGKAGGARVLDRLLPGPLDVFAVFSSTSVRLGPPGQVDYVAAHAVMESLVACRPDGLVLRWGVWADRGMAARQAGLESFASVEGAGSAGGGPGLARLEAGPGEGPVHPVPPPPAGAHPLLGAQVPRDGGLRFETWLDPQSLWPLHEHRVAGRPVLPGTAYLEIARAAVAGEGGPGVASDRCGDPGLVIRDWAWEAAMVFADTPRQLRVEVDRLPGAEIAWQLRFDSRGPGETGWTRHARGSLERRRPEAQSAASAPGPVPVPGPWSAGKAPQADHPALGLGPRWDCVTALARDGGQVAGRLVAPPPAEADMACFAWHPALLDIALTLGLPTRQEAGEVADGFVPGDLVADPDRAADGGVQARRLFAPVALALAVLPPRLPPRLTTVCTRCQRLPGGALSLDLQLQDEGGGLLGWVRGLRMQAVDPAGLASGSVPAPRRGGSLQRLVAGGLRAEESEAVFERALACGQPVVTVSTLDLDLLRAWFDAAASPPARPQPSGPETQPGEGARGADAQGGAVLTPLESALAAIWGELLGVAQLKKDDDFFSLGGHSLVAVRLFARVRRQFGVDLPLSTLFEGSTLARLAARIARELPPERTQALEPMPGREPGSAQTARPPAAPAPASPAPGPSAPRFELAGTGTGTGTGTGGSGSAWSPLVAIRPASEGRPARRPLVCVHGAGGNVLNFRLLADRLDPEQPFFGLQAQGVDGRLPPLASIEAMAAQYLQALRAACPAGPYRLAGYSAGGVIALEMARQLHAEGEQVELLAMIDTLCPVAARRPVHPWRRLWLMRHWSPRFWCEWPARRRQGHEDAVRHAEALARRARGEPLPPQLTEALLFHNFLDAQARYQPAPWVGDLYLFRAREAEVPYLAAGERLGWERWIRGRIEVAAISGSHFTMMRDPGLGELANALRALLDRLDGLPYRPCPRTSVLPPPGNLAGACSGATSALASWAWWWRPFFSRWRR